MHVGEGPNSYTWTDDWAGTADSESAKTGWAHHGVVVSESGDVITYHQGDPTFLVYDQQGHLQRTWESDLTEAHGITLVNEGDAEYLWVADNGAKREASLGYEYLDSGAKVTGQVMKLDLNGQTLATLETPPLEVYRDGDYKPTWVAVNEERYGGNGDVWVADGYGANYIHRYDAAGNYRGSINGEEGRAGAFECPHAILFDPRRSEPELYVADRSNARVQVYDPDGAFKRSFGQDFLTSPSGFVTHNGVMVIAELKARLVVLDADDAPMTYLGDNRPVAEVGGWPNNLNDKGEPARTSLLQTGRFNSPHGMAVDADGNLYVEEWLIGGRFIRLDSVS